MQISISNLVGSMFPFYNGADYIVNMYTARVTADGGYYEGIGCVKNKLGGYSLPSQYSTRVQLDGGYQEAAVCATRAIQELSL